MLQIVETGGRMNEKGCIEIPMAVMEQAGIHTGEAVKLLYMAEGEESLKNPAKEFLLVREDRNISEELMDEEKVELRIPPELLADAGIPMDADLDIVCMDQKIVIMPSEESVEQVIPKELMEICEELGIPKDKVKIVLRTSEEGADEKSNL